MDERRRLSGTEDELAPWEAELAQRLAALRHLPTPPSLTSEATRQLLQQLQTQDPPTPARRPPPLLRLSLRLAIGLIVGLIALAGTGYATATSLPGNTLYGLKRQAETVQLTLSSPERRPELAEALVERRLGEVEELMAGHAPAWRVQTGVSEYMAATAAIGNFPATPGTEQLFRRHLKILAALEATAQADTRPSLVAARRAAEAQVVTRETPAPNATPPQTQLSQITPSPTLPPVAATALPQPARSDAPARTGTATATLPAPPTVKVGEPEEAPAGPDTATATAIAPTTTSATSNAEPSTPSTQPTEVLAPPTRRMPRTPRQQDDPAATAAPVGTERPDAPQATPQTSGTLSPPIEPPADNTSGQPHPSRETPDRPRGPLPEPNPPAAPAGEAAPAPEPGAPPSEEHETSPAPRASDEHPQAPQQPPKQPERQQKPQDRPAPEGGRPAARPTRP